MVPWGLQRTCTEFYVNYFVEYCTVQEYSYYTSISFVVQFKNSSSEMVVAGEYKTAECYVRCVENEQN